MRTRNLGISREVGEEVEWKGGGLGRLGMARPQGGRPGGLSLCTPRPFSQTLGFSTVSCKNNFSVLVRFICFTGRNKEAGSLWDMKQVDEP